MQEPSQQVNVIRLMHGDIVTDELPNQKQAVMVALTRLHTDKLKRQLPHRGIEADYLKQLYGI